MFSCSNVLNIFNNLGTIGLVLSVIIKVICIIIQSCIIGFFITNFIIFSSIVLNKYDVFKLKIKKEIRNLEK